MSVLQAIAADQNTWIGLLGLGTVVRIAEKLAKYVGVVRWIGRLLVRAGAALGGLAEAVDDVSDGKPAEAVAAVEKAAEVAEAPAAPVP